MVYKPKITVFDPKNPDKYEDSEQLRELDRFPGALLSARDINLLSVQYLRLTQKAMIFKVLKNTQ